MKRDRSELCETLGAQYGVDCTYLIADAARLTDVHRAGKQLAALDRRVDVLIHNAGIFLTRKTFTADGLEMVFQVNYLSSFILNHYLRAKFIEQKCGRILFVNSEAHRFAVMGSASG
jgi:retinol dehydrogenase 13